MGVFNDGDFVVLHSLCGSSFVKVLLDIKWITVRTFGGFSQCSIQLDQTNVSGRCLCLRQKSKLNRCSRAKSLKIFVVGPVHAPATMAGPISTATIRSTGRSGSLREGTGGGRRIRRTTSWEGLVEPYVMLFCPFLPGFGLPPRKFFAVLQNTQEQRQILSVPGLRHLCDQNTLPQTHLIVALC